MYSFQDPPRLMPKLSADTEVFPDIFYSVDDRQLFPPVGPHPGCSKRYKQDGWFEDVVAICQRYNVPLWCEADPWKLDTFHRKLRRPTLSPATNNQQRLQVAALHFEKNRLATKPIVANGPLFASMRSFQDLAVFGKRNSALKYITRYMCKNDAFGREAKQDKFLRIHGTSVQSNA